MLVTLAFRHLLVRKRRSLFLLLGYSLGVGVMIVLLSIGEAMLAQSRDVALVGGGEVTVLPQGIDVEAMRTGGLGGMFFSIDRARFVGRQLLGGPRERDVIVAVSPTIENKLIYITRDDRILTVRAAGEIPSRSARVGTALDLLEGTWSDSPADSAYASPSPDALYHELDHFHRPPAADSTWGEWHYFNVVGSPNEWWYITYLVGGLLSEGKGGGQLIVTHRKPDGAYERFTHPFPADSVTMDTTRADLSLGSNQVRQRDGAYHLTGALAGGLEFDLTVRPEPQRYFPAVELRSDEFVSGYVVPGLRASATGRICQRGRCEMLSGAAAYHDHNWGVWRDVSWEWGMGRGTSLDLLYGGVINSDTLRTVSASPFFLALVDSLGVRQALRFSRIGYVGSRPANGATGVYAPERFEFLATREADTVRIRVTVLDALASETRAAGFRRYFLQMRGRFMLEGMVGGAAVADSGLGFFETYVGQGVAGR